MLIPSRGEIEKLLKVLKRSASRSTPGLGARLIKIPCEHGHAEKNNRDMRTETEISQTHRRAQRNLQVCSMAAVVACLLLMIWAFVPVLTASGGASDIAVLSHLVLLPLGFVLLNVAGVVLTSSIVAAMFAQASWRGSRHSIAPLLFGVLLFGAETLLMWQVSLALGLDHRANAVLWFLAGIALSFLSTWLLLEPLLRRSPDLSDAARLDGLGFAGSYRHVMLPFMKRRMLVASLLPFAASLAYLLPTLAAGL